MTDPKTAALMVRAMSIQAGIEAMKAANARPGLSFQPYPFRDFMSANGLLQQIADELDAHAKTLTEQSPYDLP